MEKWGGCFPDWRVESPQLTRFSHFSSLLDAETVAGSPKAFLSGSTWGHCSQRRNGTWHTLPPVQAFLPSVVEGLIIQ